MRQRTTDGTRRWLACVCVVAGSVVTTVVQVVSGSCDDGRRGVSRQGRQDYQEDKCWYELWYFWFIVALVFLTVAVLVLFFCKQQVKRSTGRQGRRCTPVLTMPMAPPQYEVPGHQPPPYHIAISSPPVSCCPHSGAQCPALHPYDVCVLPPGYVGGQEHAECQDNMSMTSLTSVGTLSNPPPYSPPRSGYRQHLHGEYRHPP